MLVKGAIGGCNYLSKSNLEGYVTNTIWQLHRLYSPWAIMDIVVACVCVCVCVQDHWLGSLLFWPGLGFFRKKIISSGIPGKSGRNLFLPVLSGQNWKKLDKNWTKLWKMSEMLKKIIIILNFLQKIMVTKAFGQLVLSKNMMQKKKQLPLAYFFQFDPDKTGRNWITNGETLKDIRNALITNHHTYFLTTI